MILNTSPLARWPLRALAAGAGLVLAGCGSLAPIEPEVARGPRVYEPRVYEPTRPPPPVYTPSPAPPRVYVPAPRPPGPPPLRESRNRFQIPPDRVPPPGTCKLWFAGLPPDRQSPPMSCEKAHADASRWGGWVIWAIHPPSAHTGQVGGKDYGPHGLLGIPPDLLPPPGLCRVWNDRAPPHRQQPPMRCQRAFDLQSRIGGRVLYMPGSDLRRR